MSDPFYSPNMVLNVAIGDMPKPKERPVSAQPDPKSVEDTAAANAIIGIVHADCVRWLERERAGSSASMNGSLDYTELKIIQKLREIGWGPLT